MGPTKPILALGQLLRDAGLVVGTDRIATALHAVQLVGWADRTLVKDALHTCFVSSRDEIEVFSAAFDVIFKQAGLGFQTVASSPDNAAQTLESLLLAGKTATLKENLNATRQVEAVGGTSHDEVLLGADFATLDADQFLAASRLLEASSWTWPQRRSRRWKSCAAAAAGSRLSLKASLQARASLLGALSPRYQVRKMRPRPVVCLLDVSSSMSSYAAMFFYFLRALSKARIRDGGRLSVFAFGTRLTQITDTLSQRNSNQIIPALQALLVDANAGTRITSSLRDFNEHWSGRVLGREAFVLLISDGLDQDDQDGLSQETRRLQASCRSLIWLNPLLRYHGFEPRARGVKAILRHVDHFLPVHNVSSLRDLLQQLESPTEILQGKQKRWK